jgi:hypothetical protein
MVRKVDWPGFFLVLYILTLLTVGALVLAWAP